MCGIAAQLRFDGRPPAREPLRRMVRALAPRGPDGEGFWGEGAVALGHRRLKVIDLTTQGSQPMVDERLGLAIAFNGCIYNYPELREQLRGAGHQFFSTSDTEVILKAYAEWGEACVDRLVGMFAFVLVELASGRARVVRDRLGIKPLYLADLPDGELRMASTLPALLAAGDVDTAIDPVALHHYLSWHAVVPAPHTILRGVRKLAPATMLTIEPDGTRRERCYWDPPHRRDPAHDTDPPEEWIERVREATRVAVRRRMVADVPVGVLLSGGLDSSLIVGLLAEHGQAGLQTFSIGFESIGETEGDEFSYSDLVADRFATDHRRIEVSGERLVPALIAAIAAMSEPMVSHDVVAFHLLSQEVSRHVKVVQSGQGADEVFAGYHWYPPLGDATLKEGLERYREGFFDRTHVQIEAMLAPAVRVAAPVSEEFVRAHYERPGADTALDRVLRLDQRVMLVDDPVKRLDNMTMAHGLEARTPFIDHELVELLAICPPGLKLAHNGKGVLKDAARGLVPDEVIDRPKGYFPVPALVQLEGPVLELVRAALAEPCARDRALFDVAHLRRLLDAPNEHLTPSGANQLWQVGLLELWLQAHGL